MDILWDNWGVRVTFTGWDGAECNLSFLLQLDILLSGLVPTTRLGGGLLLRHYPLLHANLLFDGWLDGTA